MIQWGVVGQEVARFIGGRAIHPPNAGQRHVQFTFGMTSDSTILALEAGFAEFQFLVARSTFLLAGEIILFDEIMLSGGH